MTDEDKTTIKIRAYNDNDDVAPQNTLTEEQNNALELFKRTAQFNEATQKLLGQEAVIAQLRDSLAKEQSKATELANKLNVLEAEQKNAQDSPAKVTELEVKVKELTCMLSKISGIAISGNATQVLLTRPKRLDDEALN